MKIGKKTLVGIIMGGLFIKGFVSGRLYQIHKYQKQIEYQIKEEQRSGMDSMAYELDTTYWDKIKEAWNQ